MKFHAFLYVWAPGPCPGDMSQVPVSEIVFEANSAKEAESIAEGLKPALVGDSLGDQEAVEDSESIGHSIVPLDEFLKSHEDEFARLKAEAEAIAQDGIEAD